MYLTIHLTGTYLYGYPEDPAEGAFVYRERLILLFISYARVKILSHGPGTMSWISLDL